MKSSYSEIDRIIKTKLDRRNPYNTLRAVIRKLESKSLHKAEYERLTRYAVDRLGL